MTTLLAIIHVLACITLILIVLLQAGKPAWAPLSADPAKRFSAPAGPELSWGK